MSIEEIRTFKDIQDGILRRGKIEDTTDNRTDIKEYINTLYQRIGREENYRWSGAASPILIRGKYSTGTLTTVAGSDEVTGSGTTWVENDHRFSRMKISGSNANFKIIRIGSTTTATLDQPYIPTGAAELSYIIWRDEYGMPPDFQSIRKLRIPGLSNRLQPVPVGPEKMDILRDRSTFREGTPIFYTTFSNAIYTEKTWATFNLGTDYWEDELDDVPRNPALVVWPGILSTSRVVHLRYTKVLPPMAADSDEPLITYGDRVVLVWGVLAERFLVNRDNVTSREWKKEYKECRKKMAADIETTDDELILKINKGNYRRRQYLEDEDELLT